MRIITKHISKTVLSYIFLVAIFLLGLQLFVEFLHEFPDIGKGNYNLFQMLICVLLNMPYNIYQFFPMSSLLGAIIALGLLASNSELIVMRVSGMSLINIASAVFKAALVALLFMVVVGEVLSPMAERKAAKIKTLAISGGQAILTREGVWLYNNDDIINVNSVSGAGKLKRVVRYQFNDDIELRSASYAKRGEYQQNDGWVLHDVTKTNFGKNVITTNDIDKEKLNLKFSPKMLGISSIDSDQKNLVSLKSYIKYRLQSGLDVIPYEFAFWQRVFAPLATLVMILLAIPFVFGSSRSATMGFRMMLGIMAGFGFYILHQFAGPMSKVYQIPPMMGALLPSLVFMIIGWLLLFRVR